MWAADYGHNGGSTYMVSRPIANTNTPQLYQSERWNSSTVQYQFAVPNGSYQVTLKFAEIWFSSGGQRVFHIVINGATVQTNFDPFTAAGGRDRAVDRTYAVNVTGGQVTIQLTPVVSNPKISALEIVQTAGGGAPLETLYTYDVYNRLTNVTMTRSSGSQTRTFTYDGTAQRLISVANPENGMVTFTYNHDGTVQKRTDAKGQEIRYTYDAKKRVTHARRYVGGVEQACQAVTYTYDSGSYSIGRLSSLQWGGPACAGGYSYTEAYTYAPPGNVLSKTLNVVNAQSQAAALAAAFTYDNEGRRTQVKYPNWNNYGTPVTGPAYTYGFDAVGRPASLAGDGQTWVQNVIYNAASQITSMQYLQTGGTWLTETRAYNARLQMTSQTVAPAGGGAAWLDLRYHYSATANNGQIESMQDLVTGETVTYQYDALQRLISATAGTAWGNAYSYDGFGNLLSKSVTAGSAPALSLNVDGNTNRITTAGYTYDLNGNLTALPSVTGMAYDVDNRLTTANGEAYAYTPANQRVWLRKAGGAERFTFYDLNGQRLAEYAPWVNGGTLYFVQVKAELYFGGKRIRSGGQAVAEDRLGSTRREDSTASRFFPWGEENGSTANDRQKFATYYRDAGTALDYANQRYYSAAAGRFLTPDPYMASGGPADPGSWNRYAYTRGDPVNRVDPSGLFDVEAVFGVIGSATGYLSNYDPLADAYVQLLRVMHTWGAGEPFRLEVIPEDALFWAPWGGDDGGGGGGGAAASITSAADAKKLAAEALDNLTGNCPRILPVAGLRGHIQKVHFVDATRNMTAHHILGNSNHTSLLDLPGPSTRAYNLLNGRQYTKWIVLMPDFYGGREPLPRAQQGGTLVHELLPNHLELGHRRLFDTFRIPNKYRAGDGSGITDWILDGCPPSSAGGG